jgi:dTDP-4-amino-4,6-dideoxygalactose transaminase
MQAISIDLLYSQRQKDILHQSIIKRISEVVNHSQFIIGPEVKQLEEQLAEFYGAKHAIGCANGTDALTVALMAFDLMPDEVVFTPSFTYVATAEAICLLRGVPYFIDVDDNFNICTKSLRASIIDAKSKNLKIRGIISVDLFGAAADYAELRKIADENNLFLISDAAQAFGARYNGKPCGGFADITTTSFFPTKPLGCYGDGGMMFTNDDKLNEKLRSICFHGKGDDKYFHIRIGMNSRLDTIQSAVLLEKMSVFENEIKKRQELADFYGKSLKDLIKIPNSNHTEDSVWAVYSLLHPKRDEIIKKLAALNIPSNVYYRTPLHLQPAYKDFYFDKNIKNALVFSEQVFCLPMHPYITEEEREYIVSSLKQIIEEIQ